MRVARELTPLIEVARKNGYQVVPTGKHPKLVKDGRVITDENGPLIISTTPGDVRNRDATVTRWIKAGVLTPAQNPWREDKKKGDGGENGESPDLSDPKERQKQALRDALAKDSKERAERTRKIRGRWEPVVARIGGWDKRGMQAEMGLVLHHYATSLGRQEAPASKESAVQMITRIRKGDTLSNDSAVCFELLLDDLEKRPLDMPLRWMELVREAKGIPAENRSVEIQPRGEPSQPQENGSGTAAWPEGPPRPTEPDHPMAVPALALEALLEMTSGREFGPDGRRRVLQIARDILALELRQGGR